MDQQISEEALGRLDVLGGTWTLEAAAPNGEPWPGGGGSTFEWHDSRAHLVQRSQVERPDAPDSISIIGCDAANGTYTQLYSDDRGVCRAYEIRDEFQPRRMVSPTVRCAVRSALPGDHQRRPEHDRRSLGTS